MPAQDAENGQVVDVIKNKGIIVHAEGGEIAIQYLQLEGKKSLDADSFVRGHRIAPGYKFTSG